MSLRLLSLLALLSTPLLCGCASSAGVTPIERGTNSCRSDLDCPTSSCDSATHVCVSTEATSEVVFWAAPPRGRTGTLGAPTRSDVQTVAAGGEPHNLQLQPARAVLGVVRFPNAQGQSAPIAGTLVFRRRGSTPSEEPVTVRASAQPQASSDGTVYTFQTQLAAGEYDVTITPDLPAAPPYFVYGQRVMPEASGGPLVISYLYSGLTTVSGTVIDDATQQPVPGVSVRLVDPTRSRLTISTIQTTGADPGHVGEFSLLLSPGATEDWALEVSSPTPSGRGPTVSQLVYQVSREGLDAYRTLRGLTIRLPGGAGLRVGEGCRGCVRVEGTVEDGDPSGSRPIGGALIDLHADLHPPGLHAGYTAFADAQVVTESDGTFRAILVGGNYNAIITPPAQGGEHAITATTLAVGSTNDRQLGRVLQVQPQVAVAGTVHDGARNAGMAGVRVEAIPFASALAPARLRPTDRLARGEATTTNAHGEYVLTLDPGPYRVAVYPGPDSGFAPQVTSQTCWVHADGSFTGCDLALRLEPPIAVSGVVVDATGTAVAEASVRAFARIREGGNPLDVELVQSSADGEGRYSMLLPSGLRL